jgi:hypothetical protein
MVRTQRHLTDTGGVCYEALTGWQKMAEQRHFFFGAGENHHFWGFSGLEILIIHLFGCDPPLCLEIPTSVMITIQFL